MSVLAKRAAELGRDKSIRAAIKKDLDADHREEVMLRDITSAVARLTSDGRLEALAELRQRWKDLSAEAKKPVDSMERQLARRVLATLSAETRNWNLETGK